VYQKSTTAAATTRTSRTSYAIAVVLCAAALLPFSRHAPANAGPADGDGASTFASSGDTNGDGGIDIGDAVWLLNFLFSGGRPPAEIECPTSPADGIDELHASLSEQLLARFRQAAADSRLQIDPRSLSLASADGGPAAEVLVTSLGTLGGSARLAAGTPVALLLRRGHVYVQWIRFDLRAWEAQIPDAFEMRLVPVERNAPPIEFRATAVRVSPNDPRNAIGPHATLAAEPTQYVAKKYVSCPEIDLLALWCFELTA